MLTEESQRERAAGSPRDQVDPVDRPVPADPKGRADVRARSLRSSLVLRSRRGRRLAPAADDALSPMDRLVVPGSMEIQATAAVRSR